MVISNIEQELSRIFKIIKKIENNEWCLDKYKMEMKLIELKISSFKDSTTKLYKSYIVFPKNAVDTGLITKFINSNSETELDFSMYKLLKMFDVKWNIREEIWNYFLSSLKPDRINNLIDKLIDLTNKITWFPNTDINRKPKTLNDWQWLIKSFEMDPNCFFSPSRMFEPFLNFSKVSMINKFILHLNDISYAVLIAHGIALSNITKESKELKKLIKINYLRPFLLLFNQNYDSFEMLPKELFSLLIKKYWAIAGLQFFRLTFGNTNNYEQRFHINCLETILTSFIEEKLSNDDISFINDFSWFKDYQAFAGYYLIKGQSCSVFSDHYELIMKAISDNLLNHWEKCKIDYRFFMSQFEDYKFHDPLHPKNNYALSLVSNAIFASDKKFFIRWEKLLKKTLFSIKPFFYSEFTITHRSCNIINFILLIHLSIINTNNLNATIIENLKNSLDIIEEIVLYPYLSIIELDEEIWNPERILTFQQFHNKELFLINEYFIKIKKSSNQELKIAFNDFIKKWMSLSSTKWRWFD